LPPQEEKELGGRVRFLQQVGVGTQSKISKGTENVSVALGKRAGFREARTLKGVSNGSTQEIGNPRPFLTEETLGAGAGLTVL